MNDTCCNKAVSPCEPAPGSAHPDYPSPGAPGTQSWMACRARTDRLRRYAEAPPGAESGYLNPYSTSTRWLRGNLHGHTCCGPELDLAESARMYGLTGYDFVAVTDHSRAHPPERIADWAARSGLVILPGEENGGTDHIIELGVHDVTPTPADGDYAARAAALRAGGGFIIGCHPQEYAHGEDNIRQGCGSLHAIEIYNGLRECRGTDETRNIALWDEMLTAGHRVWAVATDDFHWHYIGPGHGWVQVQVPEDALVTWPMLVEQLKRGAFYATTYPLFELIELGGGLLRVLGDGQANTIRVIGPGGRLLTEGKGHELEWSIEPGLDYFRIELRRGIKTAWSQPFFRA